MSLSKSTVLKLEAIKGPSGPRELKSFREPDSVQDCKIMSDQDIGGYSTVQMDWEKAKTAKDPPAYARFHGTISTQLPKNRPDVQRSGFAGWRTMDRPPTIFGKSLWDVDPYKYLALRVKSDGRAYFINLQTESVIQTDLHQHRLFVKRPGEWETVLVKWSAFVRTNMGYVVEPQTEILRQKIRSVGISLTDRIPGPYEVCIDRIWATNDASEADGDRLVAAEKQEAAVAGKTEENVTTSLPSQTNEAAPVSEKKEGQLKTKSGKKISW